MWAAVHRLLDRDDLRRDARAAAATEHTRRRAPHRRRHVHDQLQLAVIIPTLSGALWDLTGVPWMAFVPLAVCAVVLTVFGLVLSRYDVAARRAAAAVA